MICHIAIVLLKHYIEIKIAQLIDILEKIRVSTFFFIKILVNILV